jgi:hypothetical protein
MLFFFFSNSFLFKNQFRVNDLQFLLELLGTYTKETALKARADASK